MTKQFLKDSLGWGFILWLIGYALGIILFPVVSPSAIGWIIMPIGIIITLLVLFKKIKADSFRYYLKLAFVWTLIAVVFDYFFLVKLFKADGYYKPDVYLYYALTFIIPLIVGWKKKKKFVFIFLAVVILAGAGIWYVNNKGNKNPSPSPSPSLLQYKPPPPPFSTSTSPYLVVRVTYICKDNKTIDAAFYKGEPVPVKPGEPPVPSGRIEIVLSDGRNFNLPQTISADGLRYANSDESFVFWSKGDSALVLEKNVEKDYVGCAVPSGK